MKRLLLAVCALVSVASARAQMTTVTASSINMGGVPIANGVVTFTPVSTQGIAIPFAAAGGGLNGPEAISCSIAAGAIVQPCIVPDVALATPTNFLYQIQVSNSTTHTSFTLQAVPNVSGATFPLDHYAPAASTATSQNLVSSYGTASPPASGPNGSFYIQNANGGLLYTYINGVPVLVTGSSNAGAGIAGPQGATGASGSSAYQIAVLNGFTGTQAQWLASLVGAQGPAGPAGSGGSVAAATGTTAGTVVLDPSATTNQLKKVASTGLASDLLVDASKSSAIGFSTGTGGDSTIPTPAAGTDYIAMVGGQIELSHNGGAYGVFGATGPQGIQGPAGTASTVPGPAGVAGPQGIQGTTGAAGASAYATAVTNGFSGTQAQWLASLVGPAGPQGIQGPAGASGAGAVLPTSTAALQVPQYQTSGTNTVTPHTLVPADMPGLGTAATQPSTAFDAAGAAFHVTNTNSSSLPVASFGNSTQHAGLVRSGLGINWDFTSLLASNEQASDYYLLKAGHASHWLGLNVETGQVCFSNVLSGAYLEDQATNPTCNFGVDVNGGLSGSIATVPSAATVALAGPYTIVTGTAAISTITVPADFSTTRGGCREFFAGGAFSLATGGNLLNTPAITANTVNKACWNGSAWAVNAGGASGSTLPNATAAAQFVQYTASGANTTAPHTLVAADVFGLGTAATQPSTAFDAAGAATTAQGASAQKSNNLSDLASASTARTNLGLGTAATQNSTAFDAAGAGTSAVTAAIGSTVASQADTRIVNALPTGVSGAAANGTTDDSSSLASACPAGADLYLTAGKTYSIGTSTTLACRVHFLSGSSFAIQTGVTLTQSAVPDAAKKQKIYTLAGTGSVKYTQGVTDIRAEWFGMKSDGVTNDTVAIQNAINSLVSGNVHISPSPTLACGLTVIASNIHLVGDVSGYSVFVTPSSSLQCNSATSTIVSFTGTQTAPIYNDGMENIALQRTVAPTGTATGLSSNWATGLDLNRVQSQDSIRGYYFHASPGNGVGHIQDAQAGYGYGPVTPAMYGSSTPVSCGFCLDSSDGNAENTIYLQNSGTSSNVPALTTRAISIVGTALNDVNADFFSSAGTTYGAWIQYTGNTSSMANGAPCADIHFRNPTFDGSQKSAVYVSGLVAACRPSVTFEDMWAGTLNSGTAAAVDIENSANVMVTDHQIINPHGQGLYIANSTNIQTSGVIVDTDVDSSIGGGAIVAISSSDLSIASKVIGDPTTPTITGFATSGLTSSTMAGMTISGYATTGINASSTDSGNSYCGSVVDGTHISTTTTGTGYTACGSTTTATTTACLVAGYPRLVAGTVGTNTPAFLSGAPQTNCNFTVIVTTNASPSAAGSMFAAYWDNGSGTDVTAPNTGGCTFSAHAGSGSLTPIPVIESESTTLMYLSAPTGVTPPGNAQYVYNVHCPFQ